MLNVSSHVDVAKETERIGAKIQKLERDLKKLEASLPKAKFTENLTQVIEAKISAVKEELKHLQDQIVFLDSIQSIKQSRNWALCQSEASLIKCSTPEHRSFVI